MALITKDNMKKLDTNGCPTSELKDKLSMSIQFDNEMAKERINLLVYTFDILD